MASVLVSPRIRHAFRLSFEYSRALWDAVAMKTLRIYLDASVLGGYFDREFARDTIPFVEGLLAGKATSIISDTLLAEMARAPDPVQELLMRLAQLECERPRITKSVRELRTAYLDAGVLTKKWADDALHVAQAVVSRADVIASWNFKHMVNPMRIRAFNGVNISQGYGPVVILTPSDIRRNWEADTHDEE